jgi:hypothetical protein
MNAYKLHVMGSANFSEQSYIQLHPLAYLVKLHIEMTMSDFIVRVAKAPDSIMESENHRGSFGTTLVTYGSYRDSQKMELSFQCNPVELSPGVLDNSHLSGVARRRSMKL